MVETYVVGVGMTKLGRLIEMSYKDMVKQAVTAALTDADAGIKDIGYAFSSSSTTGFLHGQSFIPGEIALRNMGFEGIPMFNVENACAGGTSVFHLANNMVKAGACDIALAVGFEKMNIVDKAKMFSVFDAGWDIETVEQNREELLAMGHGVEVPPGTTSDRPYSVFMDVYAAMCRAHMRKYGTTQRQIAAVAAKNHQHSVHNAYSQFREAYSIEQVLAAPPITYPLTLPMCAPISDGAAAVVVCNKQGLNKLNAQGRAVKVLASVVQTGSKRAGDDFEHHLTALAAQKMYDIAGVDPKDVSLAEVHDATAMGEIVQAENLQLVSRGEAGPAAERGDFTIGGRVPINTSGGLESKGHPISASGLGQIHELVTQLRGEAGLRQVAGARIAAQENGGGLIGVEEAVAVLNLFERA